MGKPQVLCQLPDGHTIVGMTVFRERIIVATNNRLFQLVHKSFNRFTLEPIILEYEVPRGDG